MKLFEQISNKTTTNTSKSNNDNKYYNEHYGPYGIVLF